jgi:hypothetical protein
MYAAEAVGERQARWTTEAAAIRLAARGSMTRIRVSLSAPRPEGAMVPARLCVAERCQIVAVGAGWRVFELAMPTPCASRAACEHPESGTIELRLYAPTLAPSDDRDSRRLGLLVDWATSEPIDVPAPP